MLGTCRLDLINLSIFLFLYFNSKSKFITLPKANVVFAGSVLSIFFIKRGQSATVTEDMERMYNRRGEIGRYGLKLKEVVKIFTSMETIRYFCDRKTEKSLYGKSAK